MIKIMILGLLKQKQMTALELIDVISMDDETVRDVIIDMFAMDLLAPIKIGNTVFYYLTPAGIELANEEEEKGRGGFGAPNLRLNVPRLLKDADIKAFREHRKQSGLPPTEEKGLSVEQWASIVEEEVKVKTQKL